MTREMPITWVEPDGMYLSFKYTRHTLEIWSQPNFFIWYLVYEWRNKKYKEQIYY